MRTPKKFLCIGGPLDGQELTRDEMSAGDMWRQYTDYNCSTSYKGIRKCICVHETLTDIPVKKRG